MRISSWVVHQPGEAMALEERDGAPGAGEVLVQVGVTANPRIGVSLQSLVVRVQVPFGTFSPLPGSAAGEGGVRPHPPRAGVNTGVKRGVNRGVNRVIVVHPPRAGL